MHYFDTKGVVNRLSGLKHHSSRQSAKAGMPPGTLISIGENEPVPASIHCIAFDHDSFVVENDISPEEIPFTEEDGMIRWVEVRGRPDAFALETFGRTLDLHPLTLEDLLNTYLRPKFEEFDNYLFFSLKHISFDENAILEQVSIIATERVVISVCESDQPMFENIQKRISDKRSRIRTLGSDYLMYMIIDTVVDGYFAAFESIGDRIEDLQDSVFGDPDPEIMDDIYALRREMIVLRKNIWPVRDSLAAMRRSSSSLISETTMVYLNDVMDHIVQIIDTVETHRDTLGGMREIYLSGLSNRMNEVMKVLTIIATIFIPLTFIAGIYGMNFAYMPELQWQYGYPLAVFVMVVIAGLMLVFFRLKRWI